MHQAFMTGRKSWPPNMRHLLWYPGQQYIVRNEQIMQETDIFFKQYCMYNLCMQKRFWNRWGWRIRRFGYLRKNNTDLRTCNESIRTQDGQRKLVRYTGSHLGIRNDMSREPALHPAEQGLSLRWMIIWNLPVCCKMNCFPSSRQRQKIISATRRKTGGSFMLPTYIVRVFPSELKSLGSDTVPVQVRLPVLFYEGTLSSVCRWKGSFFISYRKNPYNCICAGNLISII